MFVPRRFAWILPVLALFAGLWLASFPDEKAGEALGFQLLGRIWLDPSPWQSVGALLIVWSTARINPVRSFLSSSPLQYLGALSFSFYIVHIPVLEAGGWRIMEYVRDLMSAAARGISIESWMGLLVGDFLGFLIVTVLVICLSDYVWRLVDKPCLEFIKRLDSNV